MQNSGTNDAAAGAVSSFNRRFRMVFEPQDFRPALEGQPW
jgi:hypothetical protein